MSECAASAGHERKAPEGAGKPGPVHRPVSSAGVMVIPLDGRLPGRSSGLTRGPRAGRPSPPLPGTRPPIRPCTGWGFPSRPGHPDRWCALTAPFHPCRAPEGTGGLFSVALSVRSPSLDVIQHPARRCPDFPPAPRGAGDHLAPSGAISQRAGSLCIVQRPPPPCRAGAWAFSRRAWSRWAAGARVRRPHTPLDRVAGRCAGLEMPVTATRARPPGSARRPSRRSSPWGHWCSPR